MENIFNDSNVNIDEYRPDSPGVIMAKRITKLKKYNSILMIFLIVFIILSYLLVKTGNLMLVIIAFAAFILASSCLFIYATKLQKELEKLPEEEKFNLNYYNLYKNVKKPGLVKNNVLMALAVNGALLKNREITRQALELMSANYQPEILYKLKNWLSSDSCEISEAELRRYKSPHPIARIAILIYALSGLLYLYAFIDDYIPIGAYKAFALYESIFYSIMIAACCVIVSNVIYNIINRNKIYVNSPIKDNSKRIVLLVLGALISIVTVGQLMPRVIYLAPFINEYLFNLQKSIYEAFMCLADVKISNYYKPYSWLPHITIGKTLTKEQMLKAVEVMQDFKSLNARIVKIGLAKVNPHEDVREILFLNPAMN